MVKYVAGNEFFAEHGLCELLDANGDVVPGKIVEADTETGEYRAIVLSSPIRFETLTAKPPLTLRRIPDDARDPARRREASASHDGQ